MSIPKEYYDLIEEARDDQTLHSIELLEDNEPYVPATEVNDVASNYMDTLRMERCKGEVPVYKVVPMPSGKDKHVTADTIITLHECDGMTDEFLFLQPSHGEWLEGITKEMHA